jgi:hypothetical protein
MCCRSVTFNNLYEYYAKKVYELQDHDPQDFLAALAKIREWDYNSDAAIALGVLYRKEEATFEEKFEPSRVDVQDRERKIKQWMNDSI